MCNKFSFNVSKEINKVLNFSIFVGGNRYPVIKEVALEKSGLIRKLYTDLSSSSVKIDYNDSKKDFQMIANLFSCAVLTLNNRNINYIMEASNFFEIPELTEAAERFISFQESLDEVLSKPNELSKLIELENKIFCLTESNYSTAKLFVTDFIQSKYDIRIIAKLVYKACFYRSPKIPLYVKFTSEFSEVLEIFIQLVLNEFSEKKEFNLPNEINFILYYLIENGINKEEIIQTISPKAKNIEFWSHLFKSEIPENHIENIKRGENPDSIPNAIRHDDSDELQRLINMTNFSLDGRATSSPYEIISFINKKQTLVEYSAFFGSIKCFKYLMLNGAKYPRYVFEIAIAGGNSEILRLIEQNDSFFVSNNSAYNSIIFHHPRIFEWLINNHPEAAPNYEALLNRCIDECSYEIFEFLIREGADPNGLTNSPALFAAVNDDNIRLLDFLLQLKDINVEISDRNGNTVLHTACLNQKIDIVQYLLKNPRIKKNSKNKILFCFF